MIALIISIFDGLAAIPKIAEYVNQLAGAIMNWYVQRQTNETLSAISDAAALSARAQTSEELYAASAAWQKALSRPRYIP